VPAIEEFGITMVEAHAAGRPVLAAAQGGALEIVTDEATGVLVAPHSVDAFAEALRFTDWERFDADRLRAGAGRFSESQFRQRFVAAVAGAVARSAQDAQRQAEPQRPPVQPDAQRPRLRARPGIVTPAQVPALATRSEGR
jgi:glycogen synthase